MATVVTAFHEDDAMIHRAIDGALTSANLSTAEKGCLAYVLSDRVRPGRYVSGFTTSLFGSMALATQGDLNRLSECFPEEVAAHRALQSGSLSAKARLLLGELAWLLD